MVDMIKKDILPAVCAYMKDLSQTACNKRQLSETIPCYLEETLLTRLSHLSSELYKENEKLEQQIGKAANVQGIKESGRYYRDVIFAQMEATRAIADEIESLVGEGYWPYPTYGTLLFSVK